MKAFVRLIAWDDTDLYVRADRIEAVYYDEEAGHTAVALIGDNETYHHVQGAVGDVMVYIRSALAVIA